MQKKRFVHNGAKCFNVAVPNIGAAKAVYYDIAALKWCIGYIKNTILRMRLFMYWRVE